MGGASKDQPAGGRPGSNPSAGGQVAAMLDKLTLRAIKVIIRRFFISISFCRH
jgi:hypothetical protein